MTTRITKRHREILAAINLGYVTRTRTVHSGRRGTRDIITYRMSVPGATKSGVTGTVETLIDHRYAKVSDRVSGNVGSLYGTWAVEITDAGREQLPDGSEVTQ